MAGGRVLIRPVILRDERGVRHRFEAGDRLPAWAAKKATNPALFEHSAAVQAAAVEAEREASANEFGVGPFSGRDRLQLLRLAQHHKIEVKDNARSEELIALLQAEGVPEDGDVDAEDGAD